MVVDTAYVPDIDPALKNPERGMYYDYIPGEDHHHTIVAQWLWLDSVCGQDLAWNGYNAAGTSPLLNEYAAKLENCRAKGAKIIFRPRYDREADGDPPIGCTVDGVRVFHADSKNRQFNHIDAIAAMLGEYRDVIAFIQAGYLGRWGEWNTAGDNPNQAPLLYNFADRIDIINYILSAYASNGVMQDVELRRPVFAKEVIDQNPQANVGLHNDCFMTTDSDMGTYSDFPGSPANFGNSAAAKLWAQSFSANKSFGGETCPVDATDPFSGPERWRSCSHILTEPPQFHMSYLNAQWAKGAVCEWALGQCYDEIRRKLGYRFEVTRVEYTRKTYGKQKFSVEIDITNSGWSRLHKPREAKLVLRNGSGAHVYDLLNGSTHSWEPGTTTKVSLTAATPPKGKYSLRLWIPDPDAPTLPPYAVKLATLRDGVNVFESNTGENNLGVALTVRKWWPWWPWQGQ
ncbi:MAG TPA: DUF4832 domain-containing protein [Ornithinimicrobium sp.]|uniref:DUF4832 domain-containing protein n=1 Tax=Ornithinimicrobium sp. TaxID=1977084 RepID=UPI002B470CEA|nr:DUF4832 domain-containing protein [Ornithinimicrobium sp.]HKJ12933.1 DUF4832 domain-containing protein [Ornithinimicrobium sp.]